jgi:hypothetical protein
MAAPYAQTVRTQMIETSLVISGWPGFDNSFLGKIGGDVPTFLRMRSACAGCEKFVLARCVISRRALAHGSSDTAR